MDDIVLKGYKELLKVGKINKDIVYNHVAEGRITTEDYKLITGEDCPELPIEIMKQNKIAELWTACNQTILAGFHSSASGSDILYGFDEMDQTNLNQQLTMIAIGLAQEPVYWKGKGETEMLPYTFDQFKQICADGQTHKLSNMMQYFSLVEQVKAATTVEEVQAIVWQST